MQVALLLLIDVWVTRNHKGLNLPPKTPHMNCQEVGFRSALQLSKRETLGTAWGCAYRNLNTKAPCSVTAACGTLALHLTRLWPSGRAQTQPPAAPPCEGGDEEVTCERHCLPGESVLKQSTAGEEFLEWQQGLCRCCLVLGAAGGSAASALWRARCRVQASCFQSRMIPHQIPKCVRAANGSLLGELCQGTILLLGWAERCSAPACNCSVWTQTLSGF